MEEARNINNSKKFVKKSAQDFPSNGPQEWYRVGCELAGQKAALLI